MPDFPPTPLHEPTISEEPVLRPTHLEIDLDAIAHNLAVLRAHAAPAKVLTVLKANAFGHGLVPVAQHVESLGVDYLGLAYLEEGIRLREAGIRSPILIMGGILGNQLPAYLEHDLTITASSVDKLRAIDACAREMGRTAKVHLKVDTGMERIGIHYYSAQALLEASLQCKNTIIEGIFSHLANSDSADLSHARLQLARFEEVLSFYTRRGLPMPLRHIANSGALAQLPESHYDLVRCGILLYGIRPSPDVPETLDVRPAMTWKSRVVYFKVVRPGHPVSYGSTWAPEALTRVVTLPVGYGDGYFRAMSGSAEVLIRGQRYPVVGRICMDQVMVDIGWDSAYNNDEVVLLGRQGDREISIEELADWAGTISYEILTNINTRVPRVYLRSTSTGSPD